MARVSCIHCAIKHLGQAEVLSEEVKLGYPWHRFIAVGHLAEAESELVEDYPLVAGAIREIRLAYMDGQDFNLYEIFRTLEELCK